MKPHILLEGPDCTGKTTMARQLEQLGWRYEHQGPPPQQDDLFAYYCERILQAAEPTVFDRLYHGELVYGPVVRGRSRIDPATVVLFDRLCRARGVRKVLCGVSCKQALERWKTIGRDELLKIEEQYKEVWRRYQKFQWDFNMDPPLPRHVYEGEPLTLPLPYVGSPAARFLFVGEQTNGPLDLAFMSTTNSSAYFNECLRAAGYQEYDVAFVNAKNAKNEPNEILQFPVVVALGEVARKTCQEQHITGRSIPHPAFWKRFHANDQVGYVGRLRVIRADQ